MDTLTNTHELLRSAQVMGVALPERKCVKQCAKQVSSPNVYAHLEAELTRNLIYFLFLFSGALCL